ncbi:MAG: hypothetical protein LBI81_02985, partial [Puniceicoccales bacterium]|nr:hypothetical protein [Puniceicoccales bacterium]
MVNNFLFENELREKANDLYVKDGQYEDVTFNTGKRQYMLSISRPGWFWSKFCNLFGLNSKFVTVAVKLEDRGCVSFEKKYGFKDKEDFDDKISQANKEIAKTLNSVLEDADKKSLLGKLNAPTAESFLEFALESPAKWKQLTDCGEGFFNAVAARLDDYGTKSFLKTALGSPEKWKLLTACGEGFRNAVLDRLDGHRAADFLEFALESPEKWERLTAFGKGFRNAVVDRLGDWAEFLLKYALRDDNKWKLLTTDKRLFDSLLDKLDDANASTAESLLKSALESHESREKLNACRPDFLIGLARKLDASTACDLLKYFLGWKGNLMQLTACGEGFLNAVAAKLDAPAAESFLEFALERPKKWDGEMWQRWDDSEKNFLNAVADRLDAPTAESLLQSALWNVEKWKCLISSRPLFEKLLDKLSNANASTAGRLLKSVLRDGEKWELINTLRSDFFTGLAGKLNAIAAESFLESALESPEKWKLVTACGKGFLNAVVAKLDDATAAGNLLEYALESSKKWEQLTACGPDFLIGLAGKLDGTAAGSLVELASDDGEIFDLLNACDKKFLTILVGKLGSNTNVSIVDNKLQFAAKNVGNSEPSEPKGAIDRMDHIIIADVCEKAFPYYAKDYPPYDEIYVIYKREKKLWINLTTEEQFELLREGARANWIDKVDQNYKKYQNLKKFNLTEEKIKEKMKPLMKTMVGEEINVPMEMKQHGPAHMIRASLLVPKIARTYKKLFKETQNITDKEIWFATFSAIFHDSMRQAGEIDLFDEYSAITAKKALMEMGFSKEECEACADAIRNKDSEVEGKSLIALLVHEADCLEFIRIILGNPDNFNANLLDQHGLTLQDRVTQDDVDQEIKNLISESTQFIRNTKNTTLSYEKFSEEFAKIDSTKPVTNIFALRKKYFAKFKNLGICKGSEEEKTLKSLIGKLCKSSPQM